MANWQRISHPYAYGGWDVKNLEWFNMALRMKSIRMEINGNDLWSMVLKAKYLQKLYVVDWLTKEEH